MRLRDIRAAAPCLRARCWTACGRTPSPAAAGIEASFREQLRRDGISGDWRLAEGTIPEQVALHARYADLRRPGRT